MSELPTVPVTLRVHLAHATVQAIADEVGADIMHIKGPSVDPALRPEGRGSVDADVLVRPAHLKRFLAGLKTHGWHQVTTLQSGGLVEHSINWYHGELGQMDVHVRFPGIQVEDGRAFERLWQDKATQDIAQQSCVVPGLVGQRLILLLHAARDLTTYRSEVTVAWDQATPAQQNDVRALAADLRAEVALAAATGHLDEYRDRPEYELWRMFADETVTTAGFTRVLAEIKAAPEGTTWPRLRVAGYVLRVLVFMPRRLAYLSGKKATAGEIAAGYAAALRRGADLIGLTVKRR